MEGRHSPEGTPPETADVLGGDDTSETRVGSGVHQSAQIWPQHLRQLQESGISTELALACSLRSANAEEVREVLNRQSPCGSGLVIPYLDPDSGQPYEVLTGKGESFKFVRVRLDDPALAPDREGKPSKYLSRAGSGNPPYILPEVARQIGAGANPIWITEGEKKALSGFGNGLIIIGLSGNYGWKAKDRVELHPLLDTFLPEGRDIYVVWDSDAALNVGFAAATGMLHEILRRRTSKLKVLVLPQAAP